LALLRSIGSTRRIDLPGIFRVRTVTDSKRIPGVD